MGSILLRKIQLLLASVYLFTFLFLNYICSFYFCVGCSMFIQFTIKRIENCGSKRTSFNKPLSTFDYDSWYQVKIEYISRWMIFMWELLPLQWRSRTVNKNTNQILDEQMNTETYFVSTLDFPSFILHERCFYRCVAKKICVWIKTKFGFCFKKIKLLIFYGSQNRRNQA